MTWTKPNKEYTHYQHELQRVAAAWFKARDYRVDHNYPSRLADPRERYLNIIDPAVFDYVKAEKQARKPLGEGLAINKQLHSGLDSQALLFNLVAPLIMQDDLAPLQAAFTAQGLPWPDGATAYLAYANRKVLNEHDDSPTSIDLVIKDAAGAPQLFIDVKLAESDFGGCPSINDADCYSMRPLNEFDNCCLNYNRQRGFATRLAELGFFPDPVTPEEECLLAQHFCFFRQLCFTLALDGSFVLLHDARNPVFTGDTSLLAYLTQFVPARYHAQIYSITIQQVVQAIKDSGRHPWINEFEQKYGMG